MSHNSNMKQHKSEMPFLWKPKGDSKNLEEQFFLKANKNQKKLIAARLGLKTLNDLEVKIIISQQVDNLFLVNGIINAEICMAVENSNELEGFVVNDGFQEIIQLNVPADRLEDLVNEEDNVTEFYTNDTIDLGEISLQNLSLLLDDICHDFQNIEYREEISDRSTKAQDGPFSNLASLLNEKMDAKTRC